MWLRKCKKPNLVETSKSGERFRRAPIPESHQALTQSVYGAMRAWPFQFGFAGRLIHSVVARSARRRKRGAGPRPTIHVTFPGEAGAGRMVQTRRQFVRRVAAAGAVASFGLPESVRAQARPVRVSLAEFSADKRKVASLRRGVAVMKARPGSDHRSWFFQAAV